MRRGFVVAGEEVAPGSRALIDLPMPKLSSHTSLSMPVHVVHGRREGPTLFVSAAVHGDELNGIEIIRRVLDSKALVKLRGTLIAVPVVNAYGLIHQSRYLPDRRDLNRSFPGSERGSLAARLAHLLMICSMSTALLTGMEAFDFSTAPRVLTRDGLFALHRGAGLMTGLLAIVWLWLRRDRLRRGWIGWWHAMLLCIALLTPLAPWLARMLEGRFEEAFALVPAYNLVSRPENDLSYLLFQCHRILIRGFLVLLGIHAAAALVHAVVLKDRLLSRMFLWRKRL